MEGWNSRRSLGCHCSGARGTDLLVRLVRCLLLSLSLSRRVGIVMYWLVWGDFTAIHTISPSSWPLRVCPVALLGHRIPPLLHLAVDTPPQKYFEGFTIIPHRQHPSDLQCSTGRRQPDPPGLGSIR